MQQPDNQEDKSVKSRFLELCKEVKTYLLALVNIDADCDAEATIENIEKSVAFRGVNAWILVFAIVVASVGLNVNSTAVIIGAMLISPLMSPIMGLGLGIGISDSDLIARSVRNLVIMVLISLIASTTYFLLSPLSDAQSELLARTRPTVFDVLIAFFGGLAGIVASSRKHEKITVVSGVAIATALMPPLCTAGYGLGTGQWSYFFGAFYLFFINSFFIALATFLMVRYLKFPRKKFLNAQHEHRVRRSIFIFSLIVIIPSIFIAVSVIRETAFNNAAIRFVSAIENSSLLDNVQIINAKRDYSRKKQTITLSLVGEPLSDEQAEYLQTRLADFDLENATLELRQLGGTSLDIESQSSLIQQMIQHKETQLQQRDSTIQALRQQIGELQNQQGFSTEQLMQEMTLLFPEITAFSIAEADEIDFATQKIVHRPVVNIRWQNDSTAQNEPFSNWIKVRLKEPNTRIVIEKPIDKL